MAHAIADIPSYSTGSKRAGARARVVAAVDVVPEAVVACVYGMSENKRINEDH